MKIVLDGAIGEEDLVLFARFLREMWRHRPDRLIVWIDSGLEHLSKQEVQDLFSQVFLGKGYTKVLKPEEELWKEFMERMKR